MLYAGQALPARPIVEMKSQGSESADGPPAAPRPSVRCINVVPEPDAPCPAHCAESGINAWSPHSILDSRKQEDSKIQIKSQAKVRLLAGHTSRETGRQACSIMRPAATSGDPQSEWVGL
jgi:hypothetical protein